MSSSKVCYSVNVTFNSIHHHTVEPRFNEPLYNEDLDITNHFLYPNNSKIYEK